MKLRYLLAVNASLLVLVGFLFWFAPNCQRTVGLPNERPSCSQ